VTRRLLFCTLALLAFAGTACGRYLTTGIATVNGVSIPKDDLDSQFKAVQSSQQFAGSFDPNNPEQRLEVERQIIVGLIQQELIRQEGDRLHVAVTEAQIAQQLQQVRSQFPSEEQFQQALKDNKLTMASLREQIGSQVLLQRVRDKVTAGLTATEAEIVKAYGKGEAFQEIKVRHILFSVTGTNTAPAKKEAEAALAQLTAGADFAAIAKKQSDDPGSRDKGGDLGYITRDTQFDQTFLAAAFALKKGQLSGLVQTQFGYHIIRVDDVRTKTLAQVHAQLAQQITQQRQQQAFQSYVQRRVKASDIVVNPRWGDFNADTLSIEARQFFVPPSPEPETQPFPSG
jgi:parvulin-like peptidyl-prolyl isomerase